MDFPIRKNRCTEDMEIRSRPSPIRYEDSPSPPKSTDLSSSHACSLALHALQERISVLEAENAHLRSATQSEKTQSEPETLRIRIRMLQETLQKSQATLKEQSAVISRCREEVAAWRTKAETEERERKREEQGRRDAQKEREVVRTKLESAVERVARLEEELKGARTLFPAKPNRPCSPRAESREELSATERKLQEFRRRESSLLSEKQCLEDSLRRSEEARKELLQYQVRTKTVMEEIVMVNEKLVQKIQGMKAKGKTKDAGIAITVTKAT